MDGVWSNCNRRRTFELLKVHCRKSRDVIECPGNNFPSRLRVRVQLGFDDDDIASTGQEQVVNVPVSTRYLATRWDQALEGGFYFRNW